MIKRFKQNQFLLSCMRQGSTLKQLFTKSSLNENYGKKTVKLQIFLKIIEKKRVEDTGFTS